MSKFHFDELLSLDRPEVPFTVTVSGKEVSLIARRLTAADQDALDAFYSDEYARLVIQYTDSVPGKTSELERKKKLFMNLSREKLEEQLVQTREAEIHNESLNVLAPEREELLQQPDDVVRKRLLEVRNALTADFLETYSQNSNEEIADVLAQVAVNVRAEAEARGKRTARQLYYQVYEESVGQSVRFFPDPEAVLSLSQETIIAFLQAVTQAFEAPKDLPLESVADPEPDGPAPLPSISEEATEASGKRTKAHRKSSK